jgi:hypothetical protein
MATKAPRRIVRFAPSPTGSTTNGYDERWNEILGATATRLANKWHRRRLARLVARVDRRVPFAGFPRARAAVRRGCERFAADDAARAQLAATLLADMVGRDQVHALRRLLAA